MRRMRRLRPRFVASKSEMRSPVYSAIFFPRGKVLVAKQPLPLIGDSWMASPGASRIFIKKHSTTDRFEGCGGSGLLYMRFVVTKAPKELRPSVQSRLGKITSSFAEGVEASWELPSRPL